MAKNAGNRVPFEGFSSPNYTQVPDEVFDVLAPDLSEAELRVLLYIIRRTFGFKKSADDISLKQLVDGIRSKDGTPLDRGAGVAKSTAVRAVKGLIERGVITAARNRSAEKGDEPTTYRLRFKADPVFYDETRGSSVIGHPRVRPQNPQQTDIQQTDFDLSNFERLHDQFEATNGLQTDPIVEAAASAMSNIQLEPATASGYAALRDQITQHRRMTIPATPRRKTPSPGTPEEREALAAYLGDFARELGDAAPLSSTITRVIILFQTAHLAADQWGDVLYQARAITQEHTAQIRTLAADGGTSIRRKNKMPYFLAVLEDLLGLGEERPASPDA
jgi:Bacteriophage replication protein O